jgi:hypothetical protein
VLPTSDLKDHALKSVFGRAGRGAMSAVDGQADSIWSGRVLPLLTPRYKMAMSALVSVLGKPDLLPERRKSAKFRPVGRHLEVVG